MHAIVVENISFSNHETKILSNVSGELAHGKITTFVGPSGAGKTTLFKLLNGLLTADTGEIIIDGKKIEQFDPGLLRRHVGIVLQEATMIPKTVYDNLALPSHLQGTTLKEHEAERLLTLVGLEHNLLKRNTKELSGGQKQKLSIARTLANEPKILLLDEITSSLDKVSQHAIEALIKDLNEKYNLTILWITHNIDQAVAIGDQTWVMMDGQVVEQITSANLHQSTNSRVQQFVNGGEEQ